MQRNKILNICDYYDRWNKPHKKTKQKTFFFHTETCMVMHTYIVKKKKKQKAATVLIWRDFKNFTGKMELRGNAKFPSSFWRPNICMWLLVRQRTLQDAVLYKTIQSIWLNLQIPFYIIIRNKIDRKKLKIFPYVIRKRATILILLINKKQKNL